MTTIARPLLFGLSVLASLAAASGPAAAQSPTTPLEQPVVVASRPHLYLELGLINGTQLQDKKPDMYGVGLHGTAGITLPQGLHLGLGLDFFAGSKATDGPLSVRVGEWQLLAVAGYDMELGPLVLRPSLGVGYGKLSIQICYFDSCASGEGDDSAFALSPGVQLVLRFGGRYFAAAQVRYNQLMGGLGTDVAKSVVIAGLGGGVTF